MLDPHCTYLKPLVNGLRQIASSCHSSWTRVLRILDLVLVLSELDLEPARPRLLECYANRASGKPPKDPVCMLRCLLLMSLSGFTSFGEWASHLRGHPELIWLSGFDPDAPAHDSKAPPAKATFYDFQNRLLNGTFQRKCAHHSPRTHRFKGARGRFLRQLKLEKEKRKLDQQELLENDAKVQKLVQVALEGLQDAIPSDFLSVLEELLMLCAVVPSAQRGVLGDVSKLNVSGDGSLLDSHANSWGKQACECKLEGFKRCDCARTYSDPEATFGWDASNEHWVFGHRLHMLNTSVGGHDLPLHLSVRAAHEADCVMGVEAVVRLYKRLKQYIPEAQFGYMTFDKGYDARAFYELLMNLGGSPLIPLNKKSMTPQNAEGVELNEDGVPLCEGGIAMRWHGYDKTKSKTLFCCPAKRQKGAQGKEGRYFDEERCPLGVACEPESKMGPYVRWDLRENPRLNPPVPRNSALYEEEYKKRTGSERVFSGLTESGGLGHRPYRRQHLFAIGALLRAIGCHAKVWKKKQYGDTSKWNLEQLFEALEERIKEREARE